MESEVFHSSGFGLISSTENSMSRLMVIPQMSFPLHMVFLKDRCMPLLFFIFMNDLPNVSKRLTFYLFADDTNIYFESSDLLTIQKVVNQELHKVRKWLEGNRLALNMEKKQFCLVWFYSAQTDWSYLFEIWS